MRLKKNKYLPKFKKQIYNYNLFIYQNNIISLTGESGSSKSETCKYLIEFLAHVSCSSEILKDRLAKVRYYHDY
jgi:myosin heavy subunit